MSCNAIVDRLLMAAADDWLGVWKLPCLAKPAAGVQDPEEVLMLSLQVIRETLEKGLTDPRAPPTEPPNA